MLLQILTVRSFSSCYRGFSVSQPCFLTEWSFCCDDDDDDADDEDGDDDNDATSGSSHKKGSCHSQHSYCGCAEDGQYS